MEHSGRYPQDAEALMKPTAVSAYLDIPTSTLYQWRYRGVGPKSMKVGRHVRYRRVDLDTWLTGMSEAT